MPWHRRSAPQARGIIVQNKTLGVHAVSLVALALSIGALLLGSSAASAQSGTEDSYPADQIEHYSIGHTTVVITDTSRNPDGSTPVTTSGRPLYLHIWYPTQVETTQHVTYTWNNPIYNQNPGWRLRDLNPRPANVRGLRTLPHGTTAPMHG
jgi:hypothetical protein